jgi:hypothetical protein
MCFKGQNDVQTIFNNMDDVYIQYFFETFKIGWLALHNRLLMSCIMFFNAIGFPFIFKNLKTKWIILWLLNQLGQKS